MNVPHSDFSPTLIVGLVLIVVGRTLNRPVCFCLGLFLAVLHPVFDSGLWPEGLEDRIDLEVSEKLPGEPEVIPTILDTLIEQIRVLEE